MKPFLPYNVLLIIALFTTGFMVFYNLALRDSFSVFISYVMPAVSIPAEPAPVPEFFEGAEPGPVEDSPQSVTFPLDLNLATEAELQYIPQVGDVLSQRIVQYRDVIGGYTSLGQLKEIKGVGDAVFEKISAYLIINQEEPYNNENINSMEE